jgi:hypothetical protein
MPITTTSADTSHQSFILFATKIAFTRNSNRYSSSLPSYFSKVSSFLNFHPNTCDIYVVHPSPQIKRAHPFECALLVQLTAAEQPRAVSRLLPELRLAASTEEQRQELVQEQPVEAVPLAVRVAGTAALAVGQAVGTAEQELERKLWPKVAEPQAVAMRVHPGQWPAAAAQTVGPVLPGRRQVARPTVPLAVRVLVQLPTVRQ